MTTWKQTMQQRLDVLADGVIGRLTYAALFYRLGAETDAAAELAIAAAVHLPKIGVTDSAVRFSMFMAQMAHETYDFGRLEETASGAVYEGRADLGNANPGDGPRYKGRGLIHLTGRANYRAFGQAVGIDAERHPEIVALPSIGLQAGTWFWDSRNLNGFADRNDFEGMTRRINGGLNGLPDRRIRLAKVERLFR